MATTDLVGCPECGAVDQLHDRCPTWVRNLPSGDLGEAGGLSASALSPRAVPKAHLDGTLPGDRAGGRR